jgi:hypothetical protein
MNRRKRWQGREKEKERESNSTRMKTASGTGQASDLPGAETNLRQPQQKNAQTGMKLNDDCAHD